MSRLQRRLNRKEEGSSTPKKTVARVANVTDRLPKRVIAVAGGALGLVALVVYLVIQASAPEGGLSGADRAAADDSPDLPGTFVPSQGGSHLGYNFTMSHTPVPYCDGVPWSGATPVDPQAVTPTATPSPTATAATQVPGAEPTPRDDCYASNPPSSGKMLGGGAGVEVIPGAFMKLPPDPNVYPRDVDIPREAIVHSLEHSSVFVGYNCEAEDDACWQVIDDLEDVVNNRIDNYDNRVIMGYFSDLPPGEIGMSAWTRYDRFSYTEYDKKRVERFIAKHSCRYDEEGFC